MESWMAAKSLHQDVPTHILPRTSGAENISEIMSMSLTQGCLEPSAYIQGRVSTHVCVNLIIFSAKSWLLSLQQ